MEAYYYSKMDKTKQAAYHAMLQGLLALEDSIPMPRLEAEDLYQVFFLLRLDHPDMTLRELGQRLGITRSGVNHRLQRLLRLGEEIMEKRGISSLLE